MSSRRLRRPLPLLVALATAASLAAACGDDADAPAERAEPVTVFAAASLREVFPRIDGGARFSFAGSGQLLRQIERGAPADVLAAASPKETQALFGQGRCERPRTFATNRLVMITPKDGRAPVSRPEDLRRGGVRVAIGGPDVPVGTYTRTVLRRLGLTASLERNVVSEEPDVGSVTSKVALGSADAGFVYVTDHRAVADRTAVVELPASAQPTVRYELCVVRRAGADRVRARRFADAVLGPQGRRALADLGFGLPPAGA